MTERRRKRPQPEGGSMWSAVAPVAAAQQSLAREQIEMPERPGESIPRLPSDPTELDDGSLMSLFRTLTEWGSYQGARLAVAEVEESYAEAEVKRLESIAQAKNAGAKNVTTIKSLTYTDPEFIEAKEVHFKAYANVKILRGIYEATEKKGTLLSRELTRRVGRDPRESRNGRWNA